MQVSGLRTYVSVHRLMGVLHRNVKRVVALEVDIIVQSAEQIPLSRILELRRSLEPAKLAHVTSHRVDALPSCHPGTRVIVSLDIMDWILDQDSQTSRIFWLNGMAGTGKTTIAKSIALWALSKGLLGASFFFSQRAQEEALRTASVVIPTLACQLSMFNDELEARICEAVEKQSTIANENFHTQAECLLTDIFNSSTSTGPTNMPLIVLDAFDECSNSNRQANQLLQELVKAINNHKLPLKLLITSRPENHIRQSLGFLKEGQLILHNIEEKIIKEDIRLYLTETFRRTGERFSLALDWVSDKELDILTKRSGNLFVYASTVIRFVNSEHSADPREQLRRILQTSNSPKSAYSELDRLYKEVLITLFDQMKDDDETATEFRNLLGFLCLARDSVSPQLLDRLLGWNNGTSLARLIHLAAVIVAPSDNEGDIIIYHPSFPEFITDANRCPERMLHIDTPEYETFFALKCLEVLNDDPFLARTTPETRIAKELAIPRHVRYATLHWATHLSVANIQATSLKEILASFAMSHVLRWLELLSVLHSVSVGVTSARVAVDWAVRV